MSMYRMNAMSAPAVSWPLAISTRTDAEHDRIRDAGEELHEREVRRDEPLRRDPRLEVAVARARGTASSVSVSCTKACDSRTPDRLSWKSALTIAMRSLDWS